MVLWWFWYYSTNSFTLDLKYFLTRFLNRFRLEICLSSSGKLLYLNGPIHEKRFSPKLVEAPIRAKCPSCLVLCKRFPTFITRLQCAFTLWRISWTRRSVCRSHNPNKGSILWVSFEYNSTVGCKNGNLNINLMHLFCSTCSFINLDLQARPHEETKYCKQEWICAW